ncbi:hypothetical protein SAMN05216410_3002 [Sanguibacter gelidistatuariae]|uniref:MinD-like ATPase involved in chromosome partitioning or flagellar assembly n=1 Tax=Sanguibacter gelidistatuariae TaxID=1814289 RepID=A0A1G6T2B1_9MICO|nr:hypothetical protein [Sanguibacter gelidistatuariae]SDD23149.1 hypothetical protein SAMN05216410_3002 [Sanguibacter gelidistatuariae]
MTLIALCSANGAPGVTTAALALAWAWPLEGGRSSLVIDADPAGSGILPGYLQAAIPAGGGVLTLAARRGPLTGDDLLGEALALDPNGTRLLLAGISNPTQGSSLGGLWPRLVSAAHDLDPAGVDVFTDAGRLGHRYEPSPVLDGADVVVLVLRPTLTGVVAARAALAALRESRGLVRRTTALLVGDRAPYGADEVARALEVDDLLVLATDRGAASILSGGGVTGWRFARSSLMRSAAAAAGGIRSRLVSTRLPEGTRS